MRVRGRLGPERLLNQDLTRGVRQVVLAADHVRDAHVAVVHRDRKGVERAPVRACDDEVVERRERESDVAANDVLDDDLALVGDLDADRALVLVSVPALEQLVDGGSMLGRTLRLAVRALVPVEPEPRERVDDLLDVLRRRALAVGVLDAQHERPARAAGEQPVVEGGAGAPDVEGARRRRCEADTHGRDATPALTSNAVMARKTWVLDTDTKGTGANMVPLEKTLADKERTSPSRRRRRVPAVRPDTAEPGRRSAPAPGRPRPQEDHRRDREAPGRSMRTRAPRRCSG